MQPPKIRVRIPAVLRDRCAGATELAVAAASVRGVLGELERRQPALHVCICDETGAVRRHVGVFVNDHHLRERQGLDTALEEGDVVTILQAVSGG